MLFPARLLGLFESWHVNAKSTTPAGNEPELCLKRKQCVRGKQNPQPRKENSRRKKEKTKRKQFVGGKTELPTKKENKQEKEKKKKDKQKRSSSLEIKRKQNKGSSLSEVKQNLYFPCKQQQQQQQKTLKTKQNKNKTKRRKKREKRQTERTERKKNRNRKLRKGRDIPRVQAKFGKKNRYLDSVVVLMGR